MTLCPRMLVRKKQNLPVVLIQKEWVWRRRLRFPHRRLTLFQHYPNFRSNAISSCT